MADEQVIEVWTSEKLFLKSQLEFAVSPGDMLTTLVSMWLDAATYPLTSYDYSLCIRDSGAYLLFIFTFVII